MALPSLYREQLSTFEPSKHTQYEGLNAGKLIEIAGTHLQYASESASVIVSSLVTGVTAVFKNSELELMEREAEISAAIAAQIDHCPNEFIVDRTPAPEKQKRELGPAGERPVGVDELDAELYSDEEVIRFLESKFF